MNLQKAFDKLRGKGATPTHRHKVYGKVYYPFYNWSVKMQSVEPEIYNKQGERLRTIFIRDAIFTNLCNSTSKYFAWDWYNFGLPVHFYTHNSMLETMGNPQKRFGALVESESILPEDYKIFKKHKGLEKDFDLIFTYSEELLETIPNARFTPFCCAPWNADRLEDDAYTRKDKNVSILSSHKTMCDLHKFRLQTAIMCKNENIADTFGTFDGGSFVDLDDTLRRYRFSICIENDTAPYFFTEKITSAFVAQTIPIYLGASKIDKFFNLDGIIKIDTKSDIKKVLSQCTKEEYESRIKAVLDNYERVKEFICPYDYMFQNHMKDVI